MSCARALARGESARLTAIARARSTSTIYPVFIKPLFNKLEPLEPGSLRDGIESLAKTVGFPLRKLFVMDGSKRSSHSNAFLFGFGSNQSIVLFDTLVKQVKEEEILGILCHEIGHWHHWHIQQSLAVVLACACRGGAGAARARPRFVPRPKAES